MNAHQKYYSVRMNSIAVQVIQGNNTFLLPAASRLKTEDKRNVKYLKKI